MSMTFPEKLNVDDYFKCPIWWADQPKFVNKLNKASDSYIKAAQKNLKKPIDVKNLEIKEIWVMCFILHH